MTSRATFHLDCTIGETKTNCFSTCLGIASWLNNNFDHTLAFSILEDRLLLNVVGYDSNGLHFVLG